MKATPKNPNWEEKVLIKRLIVWGFTLLFHYKMKNREDSVFRRVQELQQIGGKFEVHNQSIYFLKMTNYWLIRYIPVKGIIGLMNDSLKKQHTEKHETLPSYMLTT